MDAFRTNCRCGRVTPGITNRREFLGRVGAGFGMLALADLLGRDRLLADVTPAAAGPMAPKPPHYAARARSVIWLFMEGGPSAMDTFDPKPALTRHHGQTPEMPIDVFFGSPGPLMKSPFSFAQHGDSGTWVCDKMPHIARHVDELALIKSCYAESPAHGPAMYQMNTGLIRAGFPSVGSWVNYGLGTENQDLPGFVVLQNSHGSKGGAGNWGAGFLPTAYQATSLRSQGSPILNLNRPANVSRDRQRRMLDLTARLNRDHAEQHPGEADLLARIQNYELAYRMQSEAIEAVDLASESESTKRLYGLDDDATRPYGEKCLLARRLVERGVRFVQVYCNDEWDAHNALANNHGTRCRETDKPVAGLLTDLKQRGLLDSTLVVWGGEFGRMPVSEKGDGRDHNPYGFLVWMAGGGVKGGASQGATDEIGWKAADSPVSVHDLHATILHLLGLDHKRLTYLHNGRRFRLTDVLGEVVQKILA
jgi:Protein of unknown function (DUF1501)